MSYQTKKQSIGYLILGTLDSELPANKIAEMAEVAVDVVENRWNISNTDTLDYKSEIADKMNLTEEESKNWRNGVYWTFDGKTVEAAGQFGVDFIQHTNRLLIDKLN